MSTTIRDANEDVRVAEDLILPLCAREDSSLIESTRKAFAHKFSVLAVSLQPGSDPEFFCHVAQLVDAERHQLAETILVRGGFRPVA